MERSTVYPQRSMFAGKDRDKDRDRERDDENFKKRKRTFIRKKPCRFCLDHKLHPDYKNPKLLVTFLSERGRIIPRRIAGSCAKHQRDLVTQIKRARIMALLPFTATQQHD